jgi:hypothetical protein
MYGSSYMFRHYIAIAWRSEITTYHVTKHNTPIHFILSTAPQNALRMLPEDGSVMPKHVAATMHK